MASKNGKASKPKTAQPARLAEQKRFQRTEDACRHIMDLLFGMQRAERFNQEELAGKYATMAGIHYRKIRNGKVLGAADFNAAVEVCTAAALPAATGCQPAVRAVAGRCRPATNTAVD
jgi:hypothetical protein